MASRSHYDASSWHGRSYHWFDVSISIQYGADIAAFLRSYDGNVFTFGTITRNDNARNDTAAKLNGTVYFKEYCFLGLWSITLGVLL